MRHGKPGAGRRAPGTEAARALEELVCAVAVLDGPRASTLLSGLSDSARPAALAELRRLERCSRAERHARLVSAFAPRPRTRAAADGIPGRLGSEVRAAISREASPEPSQDDSPTARWARRVLLELGEQ